MALQQSDLVQSATRLQSVWRGKQSRLQVLLIEATRKVMIGVKLRFRRTEARSTGWRQLDAPAHFNPASLAIKAQQQQEQLEQQPPQQPSLQGRSRQHLATTVGCHPTMALGGETGNGGGSRQALPRPASAGVQHTTELGGAASNGGGGRPAQQKLMRPASAGVICRTSNTAALPPPPLVRKNARAQAQVSEAVEEKHAGVLEHADDFSFEAKYNGGGSGGSNDDVGSSRARKCSGALGRLPVTTIEVADDELRATLEEFDAVQLDAFGR